MPERTLVCITCVVEATQDRLFKGVVSPVSEVIEMARNPFSPKGSTEETMLQHQKENPTHFIVARHFFPEVTQSA